VNKAVSLSTNLDNESNEEVNASYTKQHEAIWNAGGWFQLKVET
jgi:hypothetical protein